MATMAAKLATEKTVIIFRDAPCLPDRVHVLHWLVLLRNIRRCGAHCIPSGLINAYIETQKDSLDASQLNKKKNALVKRAEELASGALLKKQYRKNGAVDSKLFNRYKKAVYDLRKIPIIWSLWKNFSRMPTVLGFQH